MPEHTDNPFSLRGKTVVQIGGSGLLGRALVSALTAAGAALVVATRARGTLASLVAEQPNVEIEEADVTDESGLARFRDSALKRHGRIDGLVFNAVTRPMRGMTDDLTRWEESMATNATGFFAAMRTFGDAMAAAGAGSIVSIASQMGTLGMNASLYEGPAALPPPDYFFHKAGMINLTRYLAAYYGPKKVRLNTVSPGGIFNAGRPPAASFLERYAQATMLGRMAEPREIGGAVIFLLSDASTYVTGANLPVDGGYTAK